MRRHFWKCGFCDTVLRSEHWLDNHMDAKHPQEVDETVGTLQIKLLPALASLCSGLNMLGSDPGSAMWQADVCFADQCSAMHCEYLSTWAEGHYVDSLRAGHCRDRVMKERRRDCRVRLLDVLAYWRRSKRRSSCAYSGADGTGRRRLRTRAFPRPQADKLGFCTVRAVQ